MWLRWSICRRPVARVPALLVVGIMRADLADPVASGSARAVGGRFWSDKRSLRSTCPKDPSLGQVDPGGRSRWDRLNGFRRPSMPLLIAPRAPPATGSEASAPCGKRPQPPKFAVLTNAAPSLGVVRSRPRGAHAVVLGSPPSGGRGFR